VEISNNGEQLTSFESICSILGELWMDYKSDKYFKDFIEYNDIGKKNVCKVYQSWSCLCYIVSKSGAKKLLENVKTPVSRPIDHYLFYNDHLDVYAIKYNRANICNIYSTTSTVQHTKKQDMTGYL